MPNRQYKNPVTGILKGLVISYLLTAAVFIIYAILLVYTSASDIHTGAIAKLTTAVCAALCGFIAARGARSRGILIGIAGGAAYILLMLAAALCLLPEFSPGLRTAVTAAVGIAGGAVGGIVGINR